MQKLRAIQSSICIAVLLAVLFVGVWQIKPVQAATSTFGKTDIGGTEAEGLNLHCAFCKFVLPVDGNITSISAYIYGKFGSTQEFRFVIFADNATLLATSANQSITATEAWNTINVTKFLSAGTYWLGFAANGVADGMTIMYHYDAGDTNQRGLDTLTDYMLNNPCTPEGWGYAAENISIYATYTIGEGSPPSGVSDPSEIRGVVVKWLDGTDTWETLADEYEPYGINWLVGESVTTYSCRSNLTAVNQTGLSYDYIGKGIEAAHSHGMNFTCLMLFGFRGGETELDPDICIVNQYGNLYRWTCPIKGHDLILSIVAEIATKYPNLDGFMFDYIRYATDYDYAMCYCEQCHQRFVDDTGLTDTNWPTDGKYFMNFLEWRNKPITELVRDVRATMLAINPNIEFSLAALSNWFEGGVGYGFPIRKWFGQDAATMVADGYIDVVCPMQYTADLTLLAGTTDTNAKFMNGWYEGKVSYVPLIGGMEDVGGDMTPENLTKCINLTRALGADGYLIYRQIPNFAEEYLSQIPNNDTFTISDIDYTQYSGDNMTVTWTTSAATSSAVEYSTSPLFYKQELVWGDGFKYYQVTNASFATVSNSTAVTSHSLTMDFNATFNETIPIYFRVQSADVNNTLTSREMFTMTTVVVTSPTNTTYYSSTISVAFSAYGDTIDKLWYNCKNGSSWIYGSNQTYTVPTSMTGFVNGTNYTFYGFANNTEGDEGQATVTFSVAIPSSTSVTVIVTYPANTTYTTSTVSVQVSASGGTIDTILWNCTYTNGTVVYANTVYTVATSMTLENGAYIFNAYANNTDGDWDEATVMFTVLIIVVPYDWGSFWGDWWGIP